MDAFLTAVFADHEDDPFAERMRAALPMLPPEPSEAQIDAWIELAELVEDASFRGRVREMVAQGQRRRTTSEAGEPGAPSRAVSEAVLETAGAAVIRGISPGSAEGAGIVSELVGHFSTPAGRSDDAAYRAELADRLATFSDRRVERYWQLIGAINGWPAQPSTVPAYEWLIAGLRA
jgi:hypothetical protein